MRRPLKRNDPARSEVVGTGVTAPNKSSERAGLVDEYTSKTARIKGWRVVFIDGNVKHSITRVYQSRAAADEALKLARLSSNPLVRAAYVEIVPMAGGAQ